MGRNPVTVLLWWLRYDLLLPSPVSTDTDVVTRGETLLGRRRGKAGRTSVIRDEVEPGIGEN